MPFSTDICNNVNCYLAFVHLHPTPSQCFFQTCEFEVSFETTPPSPVDWRLHTLWVTHTKKNWSEREAGGFCTQIFFKENYQMQLVRFCQGQWQSLDLPGRLWPSVKIVFRNGGKVRRGRSRTKKRQKRGGKGCVHRFVDLMERRAGAALERAPAAPARSSGGELGAPLGPFELWPLDKNTLLKKWRPLSFQNQAAPN